MKIKSGDIVTFIAISWNEPQWEFDHPTVVLQPIIKYSPNGETCEAMIQDIATDFICEEDIKDEDTYEEFYWRGWKLSTLRKVAKNRLSDKDDWKSKILEVVQQKVKFIDKNGELEYEIIETITK